MESGVDALAAAARTSQDFVVEDHGLLRDVDTTVLGGHLVGLTIPRRRGMLSTYHVVGAVFTGEDLVPGNEGNIVLRNTSGRCELYTFSAVKAAVPQRAQLSLQNEYDALLLRNFLSKDDSYQEAQPDITKLDLQRGQRSPIYTYLTLLRKIDWLSRRQGFLWTDTSRVNLEAAYYRVRRMIYPEYALPWKSVPSDVRLCMWHSQPL